MFLGTKIFNIAELAQKQALLITRTSRQRSRDQKGGLYVLRIPSHYKRMILWILKLINYIEGEFHQNEVNENP